MTYVIFCFLASFHLCGRHLILKSINMKLNLPVSTLMTIDVITLDPKDKLQAAKDIFESHSIHHIPVMENGNLVGILSKTDYLYFMPQIDPESNERYRTDLRLKNYTIREAMMKGVITVRPDTTLKAALEIFSENLFHALPVIDNGQLKGILTTHDILFRLLHPQKKSIAQ